MDITKLIDLFPPVWNAFVASELRNTNIELEVGKAFPWITANVDFTFGNEVLIVVVSCHAHLAKAAAAKMFYCEVDDVPLADMQDVMGEIANQFAGGIKSCEIYNEVDGVLSLPSVIYGQEYLIKRIPQGVKVAERKYLCTGKPIVVEIHRVQRNQDT